MADTINNDATTAPDGNAPKTPKQRAAQDKQLVNTAVAAGQMLDKAIGTPEIAAALAQNGYPLAALNAGRSLASQVQTTIQARQDTDAAQDAAATAKSAKTKQVRADFASFRKRGAALFKSSAERTALGLSGPVPGDQQLFLSFVRAAYAAAQNAPYAATLAQYGFSSAAITARLADIDELDRLTSEHDLAQGAGTSATKTRDTAYAALTAWLNQFKPIASDVLSAVPGAKAQLGLK